MKTLLIILILSSLNLSAYEYPFDVERINVDFNGICSNHNSIIAYGTGSMILRTTDDGNTWEQIKVAHDSLEIMKIINLNDNYFGILTDNYLVSSIDNGKTWKKVKVSDNLVYDINSSNDNIYLLSDKQVLVYDVGLNYLETLNIDFKNSRKKFLLSNKSILIPQDTGKLIIYDAYLKKQIKMIDFRVLGLCTKCIEPFNLSVSGNNIFMTLDNGDVIKSTDVGFTWNKITSSTSGIGKAIENEYYYLYQTSLLNSFLAQPAFYKTDTLNQNYSVGQNDLDRIVLLVDLSLKDFIKVNTNEFYAVGKNKTILKSTNSGTNWFVFSHFPLNGYNSWINDKLCYNYSSKGIVKKTTNSGITWIPQKSIPMAFNQENDFNLAYFDSLGNGFVYKTYAFSTNFNFMITSDSGETFEYLDNNKIRMNISDNLFSSRIIKHENGFTLLNNMVIGKDHYTAIYSLDKDYNFIGVGFLDSIVICDIFKLDEDNFVAMAFERKEPGPDPFDSDSFLIKQYFILNSTDFGKTWTKDRSLGYQGFLEGRYRIQDNILFLTKNSNPFIRNWVDYSLHSYNLVTKELNLFIYTDSLSFYSSFLKYNDLLFVNGFDNNILNINYPSNLTSWLQVENTPCTFSDAYTGKNLRLVLGKFKKTYNLYKLIPKDTTTGLNVETQTALYANPPYPIPARNYISCQIFWDQRYDIDLSIFKVYNIYGSIVSEGEDFALNKTNSYSGILTWSPTSDLPVGTYYIKINHGDAVKVVPVILLR